ncbi:MAG TPA: hypothetical protein VN224_01200 [Xanthomonadales bacterium]|nr:hypothetical protein [Xanthomonadales bacterium]
MMAALFRERCQFENSIYRYAPLLGELRRVKRAARRFPDRFTKRAGEGKPSCYAPGDWVRVKDADAVRATLDANDALRSLPFTDVQWAYCGRTFQVETVVRRMMNDSGRMRTVGRTVALAGVTCDGPRADAGCGRACPLLFRDEWLAPCSPDRAEPLRYERYARVKPLAAILATLDRDGRRDGVMFSAGMDRFAGARLPVHKRVEPIAARFWRRAGGEWYVLAGARCSGDVLNGDAPCHRGCGLLWHRDWLELDPD